MRVIFLIILPSLSVSTDNLDTSGLWKWNLWEATWDPSLWARQFLWLWSWLWSFQLNLVHSNRDVREFQDIGWPGSNFLEFMHGISPSVLLVTLIHLLSRKNFKLSHCVQVQESSDLFGGLGRLCIHLCEPSGWKLDYPGECPPWWSTILRL